MCCLELREFEVFFFSIFQIHHFLFSGSHRISDDPRVPGRCLPQLSSHSARRPIPEGPAQIARWETLCGESKKDYFLNQNLKILLSRILAKNMRTFDWHLIVLFSKLHIWKNNDLNLDRNWVIWLIQVTQAFIGIAMSLKENKLSEEKVEAAKKAFAEAESLLTHDFYAG